MGFLGKLFGKKKEDGDPFADLKRMQTLHKQAKEKKNT